MLRFLLFFCISVSLYAGMSPEEVLSTLSLEEKIGQLFVAPIGGKLTPELMERVKTSIQSQRLGGIILTQGDPLVQIEIINCCQKMQKIPLITMQDAEWGLTMRLEPALRFPKNMALGAIQDESLLYLFGKEIGRELALVGIHVGLMPVVDVNTNPANPIIGERSFGDIPEDVARKALLVMRGVQEEGVLACAKHFPGHGDTFVDSHLDLPVIERSMEELQNSELVPFVAMIENKVGAIMPAHLSIPSLDQSSLFPSSLSSNIVDGLLKKQLGFNGLVITDALNMKGVMKYFSPREAALRAFLAGNDLLLFGAHLFEDIEEIHSIYIPEAILAIKQAVIDGKISEVQLDERVLKILKAKEVCNLFNCSHVPFVTRDELFTEDAKALKHKLYKESLTLVRDQNHLLPIATDQIVHFQIGGETQGIIEGAYYLNKEFSLEECPFISPSSTIVISLFDLSRFSKDNFNVSSSTLKLISALQGRPVILVLFGSPYALSLFDSVETIMVAYEDDPDTRESAMDAIFGTFVPSGKLPILSY
ncbi:MAG: glycoside hydrolase family 3 N-terminal domain-containing protein [Chlamydiales bacterium]|nr:glycoside hydrolase family 3 N-terminal domain-containing protein [Chlamydiales bacterium]